MSKRHKTDYKGVFYRIVPRLGGKGDERSYFVVYKVRVKGKVVVVETAVGRQFVDDMTPARAAKQRALLIEGKAQTREEEREAERQRKIEEQEALEQEQNRPTLGKLFQEFEIAKADRKSLKDDRSRWNAYLAPDLADKLPSEIVTLDVQRINKKLKDRGLSQQTRKHALVLLKRIISHAVNAGRIPNPYGKAFKIDVKAEIGKLHNETTEDLTQEQLDRLLVALNRAPDQQAANVMRLALATGMRRSELYRLRWDDCLFDRGLIRIVGPKGGRDVLIPMNATARRVLENIPRITTTDKEQSSWVFPGRNPQNHVVDLKKPINAIKRDAQLPKDFRPLHGLRHAFACNLMNSGKVTLPTLQRLMTHRSVEMTLRYGRIRDKQLEEASSVMDEILTQAQGSPGKVIDLEAVRTSQT